jgi:hypothetical protein
LIHLIFATIPTLTAVGIRAPVYSPSPTNVLSTLPTHPPLLVGIDTPEIVRQGLSCLLIGVPGQLHAGPVKRAQTKMSNVTSFNRSRAQILKEKILPIAAKLDP